MYLLHIYGGTNIEESKEKFETEEEAMKKAEMMSTDDTAEWEQKRSGSKVLVDYNNSDKQEDIVLHTVKEV